jgi:uncharacterized protein YecT (DUF1311 family)
MKLALPLLALALAAAADPPWDWSDPDQWTDSPDFADSKALCRQLKDREPPASDRPDAATAASLKDCDSEKLYYGIGVKADPVRARQCAFVEAGREEQGAAFSGRDMLMTIYANGVGAKRDYDVAIHLACGVQGAPMESHGRVMHLAEMKAAKAQEIDFHFCDHVTSGYGSGLCAMHGARITGAKRDAALAQITSRWSPVERKAFEPLLKSHAAFVEASASGETDLSGTARGAFVVEAEEALKDEFVAILRGLSAGKTPQSTAAQAKSADAALNAAYRKLMAETGADEFPGSVTIEGIRNAQRAWLRYRDAFAAFAAVKFPSVSRDTIVALLTRKRTEMLAGEGD